MALEDQNNPAKMAAYRHFRGKKCLALGVAGRIEIEEESVVYQALGREREIWARPKKMFLEKVTREEKTLHRFEYLTEE